LVFTTFRYDTGIYIAYRQGGRGLPGVLRILALIKAIAIIVVGVAGLFAVVQGYTGGLPAGLRPVTIPHLARLERPTTTGAARPRISKVFRHGLNHPISINVLKNFNKANKKKLLVTRWWFLSYLSLYRRYLNCTIISQKNNVI
jgi:hypothetical protein